jgi:hypothetical protein
MAVTYDVAVKTSRMGAVRTYFDNGTIELQTAASAVLVTFGLGSPAGSVTGAVWTLTPLDAGTVAATGTGTATKAVIKTSGGSAHITGLTVTATGGGGDVILDSTSITTAQNVTLSTATITHAV